MRHEGRRLQAGRVLDPPCATAQDSSFTRSPHVAANVDGDWDVDDVDGFYREDRRPWTLVSAEGTDTPRGLRECGLRTPDGHWIACGEPIQVRQPRGGPSWIVDRGLRFRDAI